MLALFEGMALRRPPPRAAEVHRAVLAIAAEKGWPEPSYPVVRRIIAALDRGLVTMAHHGQDAYRNEFELVLRDLAEIRVFHRAVDGVTCLERVRETTPDILILDIGMPGGGPHVATAAKALQPDLHILVFSGINDPTAKNRMLSARADDYVVKTGRLRPLLEALNRAFDHATQPLPRRPFVTG